MKILIGRKIEMSQMFDEKGLIQPVTLVKSGKYRVSSVEKGADDKTGRIVIGQKTRSKTTAGKKKTAKKARMKIVKGFKVDDVSQYKVGDKILIDQFEKGDKVKVYGTSKGKGFQGVVKKYNFGGDLASHGRAHSLRKGGSIATKRLSKVSKGQKMPSRMGGTRVVVFNLEIAGVDKESNIIAIKGAIPGPRGSMVEIVSK